MISKQSFSVVIVSSGRRTTKLKECLAAVFAQEYPRRFYEVIVVDSQACPETVEFLRSVRLRHKNLRALFPGEGNIGPARGRNLGVAAARGEIVAFTDDDCLVSKNWLPLLAEGYRRYPEVVGVGGIILPKKDPSKGGLFARFEAVVYKSYQRKEGFYISERRNELPVFTGNMSYRKVIFSRLGGFSESFPPFAYGEDGDLKERALKGGFRFLFVPAIVYHNEDYNFLNFWQKEEKRGAGILKFRKEHGGSPSRAKIVLKLLFLTLPAGWLFLIKNPESFFLVPIAVLAFAGRQWGKLKYYERIYSRTRTK